LPKKVAHLDGGNVEKGEEDHSRFVVTGRNTPELFGSIDYSLNPIAAAVLTESTRRYAARGLNVPE